MLNGGSGRKSVREALLAVLDEAMEVGPARLGNIQVVNLADDALEIVVHRGFQPAFLQRFARVRREDTCCCGRAWRHGRRFAVPSVHLDAGFAPYLDDVLAAGYQAVQSTPIVGNDGKVIGVMSTHFAQPQQPSTAEGLLLDHCAARAARLIEDYRAAA